MNENIRSQDHKALKKPRKKEEVEGILNMASYQSIEWRHERRKLFDV